MWLHRFLLAALVFALTYVIFDGDERPERIQRDLEELQRAVRGPHGDYGAGVADLETQFGLRRTDERIEERLKVLRAFTGNYDERNDDTDPKESNL